MASATAKPTRRKGPLSPDELIDLRKEQLQIDEDMVERLVEEAKADFSENLLEPIQATTNPTAVIRHRLRFLRVMGATAQLKTNGLVTLIAIGTLTLFLSVMLWNPRYD